VLYRAGGATAGASTGRRTTVVIAHLAWLAMLIAGAVGATVTSRRQRARSAAG
jgi:hypothetical protein